MTFDAGRIRHDDGLMHYARASNGSAIPSNWIRSTDGTTAATWRPESASAVSYGSNSNDVTFADAAGASALVARADHAHRGVTSLAHSSNTYTGPVTLETEGSLYIVRSAANTYRFGSSGGSGSGAGTLTTVKDEGSTLSTAVTSINFVGAGVTATGTTAVTVTIPGGSTTTVTVIEPAAQPDTDDDEGTGAVTDPITGWTTLGTVTTLDRDTTFAGSIYLLVPANAGTRVDGLYKSRALVDGEAFIARVDADTIRASFNRFGIFIGVASAAGRIDTMGLVYNAGNLQQEVLAMTNATTFSATVVGTTITRPSPMYLAIRRNSSTSWDYLWGLAGPLGIIWTTAVSARNPSFTQAVCGLFANAQNGSTTVKAVFNWARYYTTLPVAIAP